MSKTLQLKVRNKGSGEDASYKNEVNLSDPNLIALALKDLEVMFDAPIQKVCSLLKKKDKTFPI
jgi:hypothetical protein